MYIGNKRQKFYISADLVRFLPNGKKENNKYIEKILKSLSLWEKRNSSILTLSGGMKRRVLIAKALAHETKIIFIDEHTAGVDVELRQEMGEVVKQLRI